MGRRRQQPWAAETRHHHKQLYDDGSQLNYMKRTILNDSQMVKRGLGLVFEKGSAAFQ